MCPRCALGIAYTFPFLSLTPVQIDLQGVCGDASWAKPMADALGWTDAFLDRILMNVILIRDEVG